MTRWGKGQMVGWTDGERWTDGGMDRWRDELMEGRTDGRKERKTEEQM
jgi:hypothetical protein